MLLLAPGILMPMRMARDRAMPRHQRRSFLSLGSREERNFMA